MLFLQLTLIVSEFIGAFCETNVNSQKTIHPQRQTMFTKILLRNVKNLTGNYFEVNNATMSFEFSTQLRGLIFTTEISNYNNETSEKYPTFSDYDTQTSTSTTYANTLDMKVRENNEGSKSSSLQAPSKKIENKPEFRNLSEVNNHTTKIKHSKFHPGTNFNQASTESYTQKTLNETSNNLKSTLVKESHWTMPQNFLKSEMQDTVILPGKVISEEVMEITEDPVEKQINEAINSMPKLPELVLSDNKTHFKFHKNAEEMIMDEKITKIARQLAEKSLRKQYEEIKLGNSLTRKPITKHIGKSKISTFRFKTTPPQVTPPNKLDDPKNLTSIYNVSNPVLQTLNLENETFESMVNLPQILNNNKSTNQIKEINEMLQMKKGITSEQVTLTLPIQHLPRELAQSQPEINLTQVTDTTMTTSMLQKRTLEIGEQIVKKSKKT